MIKLTHPTIYNARFMHRVVELIADTELTGIFTGSFGTRIELQDTASDAIQTNVNNLFTNINTLPVLTDKAGITADDADTATITLVTIQSSIEYLVLLDGAEYASDSVIPSAGTATLTLATALPGTYTVILMNPDGSATGQVEIVAS